MGRPTDCTPEVTERICAALSDGNYIETAAECGGVAANTVYEWIARGARGEQPFAKFRDAVQRAEAEAEATLVAQWKAQVPANWQAARDLLARRHPARWAETHKVLALVQGEIDGFIEYLANSLRPETFREVAAAVMARKQSLATGVDAAGDDAEAIDVEPVPVVRDGDSGL